MYPRASLPTPSRVKLAESSHPAAEANGPPIGGPFALLVDDNAQLAQAAFGSKATDLTLRTASSWPTVGHLRCQENGARQIDERCASWRQAGSHAIGAERSAQCVG